MTADEFQTKSRRTIDGDLTAEGIREHALFGLMSEVGEVASLFQHVYQGEKFSVDRFIDEMGDVMWMIAELCTGLGVSLNTVLENNVEKLLKRYPNGFEKERSVNRHKDDSDNTCDIGMMLFSAFNSDKLYPKGNDLQ